MLATRLTDIPEYADAHSRLQGLRLEFGKVEAELNAARAASRAPRSGRVHAAALSLLDGAPGESDEEIPTDVGELEDRRTVLREGVRIQEGRVREVREAVSRRVAEAHRAEYVEILQRAAAALVALGLVADEEWAFRDRFREGGISFAGVIPPVALTAYRLSSNEQTRTTHLLDECERLYSVKTRRRS